MNPVLGRWLIVATAALTLALPIQARQVASKDGLTAATSSRPDWCQSRVQLVVRSDRQEPFTGDRLTLHRLLAEARMNIEDDCPAATEIELLGFVGSEKVFTGVAAKTSGWGITAVAPASAPQVAQVQPAPIAPPVPPAAVSPPSTAAPVATARTSPPTPIQQCDRLAAHADDPEAFAPGVPDDQLSPQAIGACEAAIRQDKNAPRLAFQLARAYLKADRFEDAAQQLITAARQGHGGALAYLGDLHMDGAPGIEADPVLAQTLYQKAVASGFKPAQSVLAQFEDYTEQAAKADEEEKHLLAEENNTQSTKKNNGVAAYINPPIVVNILTGRLDDIPYTEIFTKVYLFKMAENISGSCATDINNEELKQLGNILVSTESQRQGYQTLVGAFNRHIRDIAAALGRGGSTQSNSDENDLYQAATIDSDTLVEKHGCQSPQIKQFKKNSAAYISDEGAPVLPADKMLNACLRNPPEPNPQHFCTCFLGEIAFSGISRADRKELPNNFAQTAYRIKHSDRQRFAWC